MVIDCNPELLGEVSVVAVVDPGQALIVAALRLANSDAMLFAVARLRTDALSLMIAT